MLSLLRAIRPSLLSLHCKQVFTRGLMPQLTLSFDKGKKALSLSPEKPRTASSRVGRSASRAAAYYNSGEGNLWKLHHQEEDSAAASKKRASDQAEGKGVIMHDGNEMEKDENVIGEREDEPENVNVGGEAGEGSGGTGKMELKEGRAKGLPTNGKRRRSPEGGGVAGNESKKYKSNDGYEIKGKIATRDDAARADSDPPLDQLMRLQKDKKGEVEKGESVVYWMRMEDMRIEDNTALATASETANKLGIPLIVLFVLSPGDYKWHDRSPRKVDFVLRHLRYLKPKLNELNIPLHIVSYDRRLTIPKRLITEVFPKLKANHVYANIEYEVDELRRDIAAVRLGRERGIDVVCVHDRLIVPPGRIKSQTGKPMSVFSPWQRAWAKLLDQEPHLLAMSPLPRANDPSIRQHPAFGSLFDTTPIPYAVEGFECDDVEQMKECWPEGTERAKELLERFLYTKARKQQIQLTSPLNPGAEKDPKQSRVAVYQTGRNMVDADYSSRLSPYLAIGAISGRMVANEAKKVGKGGKLESGRDSGVGMWVQEVAWRDFYNHVMSVWPRVSMGRPFLEKFADVQWEVSGEHLQAWKDGKTGYPIVDAAMRACNKRGWMENRVRMVAACFLVKDLMLDWRLGEKYFMENFIDGDLAANNGGWQWTASTGTDPQPYFRIFNTLTQSEKCDPNGDYIRYWVPELRNLKGKAVHDPFHNMPSGEFRKLGYPAPIVDHKKARERALFRYKNVGEKEDGG